MTALAGIRAYIAGPMRGYPRYNFDAFMAAEATLIGEPYRLQVVNPARLDIEAGFDPDRDEFDEAMLPAAMRRDIAALLNVDAVVLLEGWEASKGVATELEVATALGLAIFELTPAGTRPVPAWDVAARQLAERATHREVSVSVSETTAVPITVRRFTTGATRDTDTRKPDYEGFVSPLVIREFGRYMHEHRVQPDGSLRDSDNWQKGIPLDAYMKSLWRHFHDLWMLHRGFDVVDFDGNEVDIEDALCACLFNVQGYLHETLADPFRDELGRAAA